MELEDANERALVFEQQRLAQAEFEADEAIRLKLSLKERKEKDNARIVQLKRLEQMKQTQILERREFFQAQRVERDLAAEAENDRIRQSIKNLENSVKRREKKAMEDKIRERSLIQNRQELHAAERAEQERHAQAEKAGIQVQHACFNTLCAKYTHNNILNTSSTHMMPLPTPPRHQPRRRSPRRRCLCLYRE